MSVLRLLFQQNCRTLITAPLFSCTGSMFKIKKKHAKSITTPCTTATCVPPKQDVKFEILATPVKSDSDQKDYRVIRLENGLTACLISDMTCKNTNAEQSESDTESEYETDESEVETTGPETSESESDHDGVKMKKVDVSEQKMAAAALTIGVGSFSDPKDIPGLAHFLEHMVFMGSTKYPKENDFDSFIKKRGGSDNASTDCEITSFHFETMDKHLFTSLDRFAQFFISPLMKKDSMTREREAIESEFQMALPSDTYRKEQLLMSLFNPEVPICTFSWGNLKTLKENINDDVLYKRLHEFRKRHYSAHRMTLAIRGRFSLDVLQSSVISCFSSVPTNNIPADDFKQYSDKIYKTPEFGKIYYIEPVKDITQVDINWAMPSLFHMYKSKPQQYISWLLGHEGQGSLLSYLKKRLWALAIYSGNDESGSNYNSMYSLFSMSIVLTKDGLQHLSDVIEAVYSYIRMVQKAGPQESIYDEIKRVEDISFKFQEDENPADFVEDLSEVMQVYPAEHYLTGPELYFEYDPQGIEMIMSHLNVENMNVMVSAPILPSGLKYDKVEPWFNTNYAVQDIPMEWKEVWLRVEPYKDFHLPCPNPFLTCDFTILPKLPTEMLYPIKVIDKEGLEIWYKKDDKFGFPVARYCYGLSSPMMTESPLASCLTDMYITLFGLQIAEEVYPATSAELDYSLNMSDTGIILKLHGYNEKLHVLAQLIARYMKCVAVNTTPELVAAVKEKQLKYYHNKLIKPTNLAKDIRVAILCNRHWTAIQKHTALLDVTYDMVRDFAERLVASFFIQGLVQGNVTQETAISTTNMIVDTLQCNLIPVHAIPKVQVNQLPVSEHCARVLSFNTNDTNSIITNYYQCNSREIKDYVIIELLMMMTEERAFDILRTKEQLGYNVYTTIRDTFGVYGFSVTVNAQATKNTPDFIDNRIELFMQHMNKQIKKMGDNKINQVKRDLIKLKKVADTEMEDEVERHWGEIWTREYMFNREQVEVDVIEQLKNSEIKKFFEDHTTAGSKELLRKLSVQIVGHKGEDKVKREVSNDSGLSKSEKQKYSVNLIGPIDQEIAQDNYFIKDINDYQSKCTKIEGRY